MKPLLVLIIVFGISLLLQKLFGGNAEFVLSGRIALSVMLTFTAVGHFVYTKGMSMMLPGFVPFKTETIYLTGVLEIAAAIGLLIPNFSKITGYCLIAFFVLVLPANIYAAIKQIDYQKGTADGNGIVYLWFRIPLQILFIVWTYISAIKG